VPDRFGFKFMNSLVAHVEHLDCRRCRAQEDMQTIAGAGAPPPPYPPPSAGFLSPRCPALRCHAIQKSSYIGCEGTMPMHQPAVAVGSLWDRLYSHGVSGGAKDSSFPHRHQKSPADLPSHSLVCSYGDATGTVVDRLYYTAPGPDMPGRETCLPGLSPNNSAPAPAT